VLECYEEDNTVVVRKNAGLDCSIHRAIFPDAKILPFCWNINF